MKCGCVHTACICAIPESRLRDYSGCFPASIHYPASSFKHHQVSKHQHPSHNLVLEHAVAIARRFLPDMHAPRPDHAFQAAPRPDHAFQAARNSSPFTALVHIPIDTRYHCLGPYTYRHSISLPCHSLALLQKVARRHVLVQQHGEHVIPEPPCEFIDNHGFACSSYRAKKVLEI